MAYYGMTFAQWNQRVNSILVKHTGMGQDDLPDWCSRDAFDDEVSPHEAAIMCLEESDMPDDLFKDICAAIEAEAAKERAG